MQVDVAMVGDFRFPGGTSTAIASEIAALAAGGYRVGLVASAAPMLSTSRMMHPEIVAQARSGNAMFVAPGTRVRASLCCLHHPAVFGHYPAEALEVRADQTLMIVHHPPIDNAGVEQYPVDTVSRIAGELFGRVTWAPVGPKVRAAFRGMSGRPPLTAADWVNVVDAEAYRTPREGFVGAVPVIGRHSRPDPAKWPDTRGAFLQAYPDDPAVRVRLMGYDRQLDPIVGRRPANWEVLRFDAMPVRDFLAGLDYFSYFHSEAWTEAFGRSVLEAMAAGLVCLLPRDFEEVFGGGAICCERAEVLERVRSLHGDPTAYLRQSEQASALVREAFGPAVAVARVRDLIGPPASRTGAATLRPAKGPGRVLYLTSNGIGMGHLTRSMASARRLDPSCQPVVATMSKAFGVVREQGIPVEYIPYSASVGLDQAAWQQSLEAEIAELLRFYRPTVFVFDGNVPYKGLIDALAGFPAVWKVWQRRGMWRPGTGDAAVNRESDFDAVIEPGEISSVMDRGVTAQRSGRVLLVPPVRLLDEGDLLSRDAARAVLALDPDRPAVLLQPGSGNNFETGRMFRLAHDELRRGPSGADVQIVLGEWRNSTKPLDLPKDVIPLNTYPISRFLNAFDYAVALAGYNTYHENIMARLPTLFLSNDNPQQDEQWLRADYGAVRGLCLAARSDDPYAIVRQTSRLRSERVRNDIRRACQRLPAANGATVVAEYIAQLAVTRKAHGVPALPAQAG